MRRHNVPEPCAAAYAALGRSGVHNLRVVTRSYSLSQLSLLKTHETLVPSDGRFQSADRLKEKRPPYHIIPKSLSSLTHAKATKADTGIVNSHAQAIRSTTVHFKALKLLAAPTPIMEAEIL